jgi:hypothetical protein
MTQPPNGTCSRSAALLFASSPLLSYLYSEAPWATAEVMLVENFR